LRKRQRRLGGVEELVLSLTAKGLTTGEVAAHLAEVYGAQVSRQTISTSPTGCSMAWQSGSRARWTPSTRCCSSTPSTSRSPGGQVTNRPIYVVLAVTVDGERDILGLWVGDGGEGAKLLAARGSPSWKNRGVADVCITVCDGLTGLPDAIAATWPQAVTETSDRAPAARAASAPPLPPRLGRHRQRPAAGLHRGD